MRILHVEDDETTAASVKQMLKGVVDNCAWTGLGEKALEMARYQIFDLILLDVMLPDIDAYEVVDRLRCANVRTPCLFVSGMVDRDSEFINLACPVDDLLVKPFSRNELLDRIRSVVARAHEHELQCDEPLPTHEARLCPDEDGRRKYRRFLTIKSAVLHHGNGLRCRIVNLSHGGAGLRLLDPAERLPHSFRLVFESGESRFCRVCWRDEDRMGVKFIDN